MRNRLVLACLLIPSVLLAASPSPPPATRRTPLETSLDGVHVAMRRAAAKLDANALYGFVLDEPNPIIESGHVFATREEALASTRRGFEGLRSITYDYKHVAVTQLAPAPAARALWVADGTSTVAYPDGRVATTPFAETIVFAQRDGQWNVLHAHRSVPNSR